MMKYAFVVIMLAICAGSAHAQQQAYTNQQPFGVEVGLPQSYFSGIIQDEDGFIWLATQDGFSRMMAGDSRPFTTTRRIRQAWRPIPS